MLRKILTTPTIIRVNRTCNRFTNSTNNSENKSEFSLKDYHKASEETLENLCDNLESILEDRFSQGADVRLESGVLTVAIDSENTYVINKQTPNRQIWLASPLSGPKRFDLINGKWLDTRTKTDLRNILSEELSHLLKNKVQC